MIAEAEALLIGAGAGMGVDSGLPDFRGNEGFWRAYPPFARLGLSFVELANPRWFEEDPALAWGFYGHRLELYRRVVPHRGFEMLREWGRGDAGQGCSCSRRTWTGSFRRLDSSRRRVLEAHGSIHRLQCCERCGVGIFEAEGQTVEVDEGDDAGGSAAAELSRVWGAGAAQHLDVWGLGVGSAATAAQEARFQGVVSSGVEQRKGRLVVVECGAGGAMSDGASYLRAGWRRRLGGDSDPDQPAGAGRYRRGGSRCRWGRARGWTADRWAAGSVDGSI